MSKSEIKTYPPRFQFKTLDGEDRELFMSSALLHFLAQQCPNHIDSIATFDINNDLQQAFLTILLSPRDAKGRPVLKSKNEDGEEIYFSGDDVPLDIEVCETLLSWAGGHVRNFFLRQLQKQTEFLEENGQILKSVRTKAESLLQSPDGSEPSTTKKP